MDVFHTTTKKKRYINLNYKLQFTRDVFVVKLSNFCKNIKDDEICIIKNDTNEMFIKDLIK